MKGWNLENLQDQGEQNQNKWELIEEISLDSLYEEPETEEEDDETTILEDVEDYATQAAAGPVDMVENTIDLFAGEAGGPKLVFNIPGVENYNPKYPFVWKMSDEDFDALKAEDKISYLPKIAESDSVGAQFTRDMTNILSGIYGGSVISNFGKGVIKGAGGKVPNVLSKWIAPGILGSLFSFKPHEPRLSDSVAELVENTPLEITQPFFEWLKSDKDSSKTEERFKIALESVLLDFGVIGGLKTGKAIFNKIYGVFKRDKNLLKAELNNATPEELAEINAREIAEITGAKTSSDLPFKGTLWDRPGAKESDLPFKGTLWDQPGAKTSLDIPSAYPPVKVLGKSPTDKVLEKVLILDQPAFRKMAIDLANGIYGSQGKVFNTNYIKELGPKKAMSVIANSLEKEFRTIHRKNIPKGPKTLKDIGESGFKIAEELDAARWSKVLSGTADELGLEHDLFFKIMSRDLDNVAGLEARILAYRTVLTQLSDDLGKSVMSVMNGTTKENGLYSMAKVMNDWSDLRKMLTVFGEVRRTTARATTAQRIPIPTKPLDLSKVDPNLAGLRKALNEAGMDEKSFGAFAETIGLAKTPLHRIRILEEATEALWTRGVRGVIELYRGLLLANVKTHVTNTLSGMIETTVTPMTRMMGGMVTFDKQVMKEAMGQYMGMFLGFRSSAGKAIESIIRERNVLDPLGTKIDGMRGQRRHAIAMDKLVKDSSYWHPFNWATLAVNAFGKVSRGSLRLLGGEDEFFKQLNYRGQAYTEILSKLPVNLTRVQRKQFIAKELDKYFDDLGRATDKDKLQYAREVTFTEELRQGTFSSTIHNALVNRPEFQVVFPFWRTPWNIAVRAIERTPGLNILSKTARARFASKDPNQRAQAIGNVALGGLLYGAAVSYIIDGSITGGGPADPDLNRIWRNAGNQPYSIKLPSGKWVSYNRLDPIMLPFVFLSTVYENAWKFNDNREELDDIVGAGLLAFTKALGDRTYMSGMRIIMDGLQASKTNNLDLLERTGGQLAIGAIPSVIMQQYEMGQEVGLYGGAEGFREAINFTEKITRKLAPVTGYAAIKHNWLTGEPIASPFGYNTGIPVTSDQPDPVLMELVRMGRSIDPPDTKIGNVELDGYQYAELNRLIGSSEIQGLKLRDALEQFMMGTKEYDFDPNRVYNQNYDDFRVKGVKNIIRMYKDLGRKLLMKDNPDLMEAFIQDRTNSAYVGAGYEQIFDLNQ